VVVPVPLVVVEPPQPVSVSSASNVKTASAENIRLIIQPFLINRVSTKYMVQEKTDVSTRILFVGY
jgi:hypothetical protein